MAFDDKDFNEFFYNDFFKKDPNNLSVFFKYITARIHFKVFDKCNDLEFLENSDSNSFINMPPWFQTDGNGYILYSRKGTLDLKIKFINDSKFRISLLGLDARDKKNSRIPIYITYTNFSINGNTIFDFKLDTCHDKRYEYFRDVKNNEILDIHLEWEPFSTYNDFSKSPKL